MKLRRLSCAGLLVALSLVFAGTRQAQANSIVVSLSGAPTVSAGIWTYTYDIALTTDSSIQSGTATAAGGRASTADGDYFSLYDLPGYITGTASNISLVTAGGASWVETDSLLGFQPDTGATLVDDPTLMNVSFQYVGTDGGNAGPQSLLGSSLSADPSVPADGFLGLISIKSTLAPSSTINIPYNGQDFNLSTLKDQSNQSFVNGPGVVPSGAAPEPAAAVMLSLTVLGMAQLVTRRRAQV
jgi:hypothetical protein